MVRGCSGKQEKNGSKSLKTASLPLITLSCRPQVNTPRTFFLYAPVMLGVEVQEKGLRYCVLVENVPNLK